MRCRGCDALLTDYEVTRKDKRDGTYLDLCDACFAPLVDYIPVSDRLDLYEESSIDADGEALEIL